MPNTSDPVVMYLLSEIAIGDSKTYEILSLEEVDELKKEHSLLVGRLDASKRKLALETKLRDAAKSLSRLHSPKSSRSSEGFDPTGSLKSRRNRSSRFGHNNSDKSDEELAVATQKCEDLALEVWRLECRTQQVQRRLLEHTAGVLQMTHKGLKKNPKSNLPRTPESIYSGNTRGSVDGFDDRSLYKTLDNLDEFGSDDRRGQDDLNGSRSAAAGVVETQLAEMSSQLHGLMIQCGLSREPTLPPPDPSSGLQDRMSYLSAVIGSLQNRIDGLLDQKSILTTQIQQQRELNSKSDADKDAHTAGLIEQLATVRKELELSERENQSTRDELNLVLDQLEAVRRDLAARDEGASEKEARTRAEEGIQRLESELEQLREEAAEGRERAEKEVSELEIAMQQLRTESDARVKEATDMHAETGSEVARLKAQLKDATEARTRAEEDSARKQTDMSELESEVARAQTELTMVKAELDGAYGSRAQRAAEAASNPAVQKEIDDLNARNIELTEELAALKAGPGDGDLQQRMQTLERELRETTDEYEAMTKASIEFEKDRERLDGIIDGLRERCEQLETQISEDRINNMGVSSPSSTSRDGTSETTSTMVLKNEFKKMMRESRVENMKILKVSHQTKFRLPYRLIISRRNKRSERDSRLCFGH